MITAVALTRRAVRAAGRGLLLGACRSLVAVGVAALAMSLSGCYTYLAQPMSHVAPGAYVAAEISDVGRVALATQIGTEIKGVEGQVAQQSDSTIQLSVSGVRFLSGLSSPWRGQEVTLRPRDVKSLTQRTYSKRKSIVAAVVIVGLAALAVAAAVFTGIFSGDAGPDKNPGGPPPDS